MLIKSWIDAANQSNCPFPLNNLPYGVFSTGRNAPRCGVAIGDQILDVCQLEQAGLIKLGEPLLQQASWNALMAAGKSRWHELRIRLTELLIDNSPHRVACQRALIPAADATLHMPFRVSEFTDFYAGRHHATNVGTLFRGPENALPPNWLHIPIGYNGRASSVVVSGTDIVRPHGQLKSPDAVAPVFAASRRFDIELEIGAIVGTASNGRISVQSADDNIFGYVLLNDWSARDIQAWEYQPLGPFQAKATATTISPWIVCKAALEPFRVNTPDRDVALLDYLREPGPMLYDIDLEVRLTPAGTSTATTLCQTNYREMYYSSAQQLAHHSSSGCPMRTGDLLGSGTISGQHSHQLGSLLEMSQGGKAPITLKTGEQRSFLEDGDTVELRGTANHDNYCIGFGACSGRLIGGEQ